MSEHVVNKAKWDKGAWNEEPDFLAWEAQGFPCRIVRVPDLGHLCGYVGVPADHPWHGREDVGADVHGGVTYARDHAPTEKPDGRWWVGFDCAHLGDFCPYMDRGDRGWEDTYWTFPQVKAETERFAEEALARAQGKEG